LDPKVESIPAACSRIDADLLERSAKALLGPRIGSESSLNVVNARCQLTRRAGYQRIDQGAELAERRDVFEDEEVASEDELGPALVRERPGKDAKSSHRRRKLSSGGCLQPSIS
jgi:hypothetical protein